MTAVDEIRARIAERLAAQRALVRELLREQELLQGSLFARYGECGKESCVCRRGRKHGPYYVVSVHRGGGSKAFNYLPAGRVSEAKALVERYRRFRSGLRRLRRIGAELVSLLRRYQDSAARRGSRRLKLRPPQPVQKN
jgi:hypothetical protein